MRQEAQNIVQDNENLLDKLDKFSAVSNVDPDRYIFLAENAQIVVNENELLKVNTCNSLYLIYLNIFYIPLDSKTHNNSLTSFSGKDYKR